MFVVLTEMLNQKNVWLVQKRVYRQKCRIEDDQYFTCTNRSRTNWITTEGSIVATTRSYHFVVISAEKLKVYRLRGRSIFMVICTEEMNYFVPT